ncbi:MAG: Bax inhibitor-1/YccA family protein [Alphaproteobacteria bacterium]|nr:Bax inhibitor-1/YccA family protein [Alphaproteobacteria bacterium]
MSDRYETYIRTQDAQSKTVDDGLRKYMLSVYNYMATGVGITGLVAWMVANTAIQSLFYKATPEGYLTHTMLGWIVAFAPLAFVFIFSAKIQSMKAQTAQLAFFGFSALMGASLAHIFFVYSGEDITRVFFISSATFAGMSLYGYTTKKDLTGMGHFLIMGIWGLFVASIVNIFLGSSTLSLVISIIGLLAFIGLTAYDTQKIRLMYNANDGSTTMTKKAVVGALRLYIDFINMFLFMLRLFGGSRD